MALGSSGGLLVISLDVDGDETASGRDRSAIEGTVRRMLELFEQRRVPATFSLAHPGTTPVSAAIAESRVGHEIALLGDASWIGAEAGRTRFARELAWRVRRALDANISLASLALRDVTLDAHLDLLVKHRIGAIREAAVAAHNVSRVIRPQLFRYGIWKAAASCRLPSAGRLWKSAEAQISNSVKRAVFGDEIVHLAISLPEMTGQEQATLDVLGRVLDRLDVYRDSNRLTACTLAGAVWNLSRVETTRRAQSLLRVA